jgi:L-lactate dehydrogenase complex protein LldF
MANWSHLAFASSLCASCSSVCPVHINIHELLLENRWEAHQKKKTGIGWNIGLKFWAWIMSNRFRLNVLSKIAKHTYRFLFPFLSYSKRKRIPDLPPKSFKDMWSHYEQQK